MENQYLENLFGLQGQTAVVIGGTGVLGGSICEGLARAGAHVIVSGRSQERGTQRVSQIEEVGGEAEFVPVDASCVKSMDELKQNVLQNHSQVDILVNCAGSNSATPYDEISEQEWDQVVDSNLKATHFGCQIFAPLMASQDDGGAILNIGSVTAHLPLSKVYAYSASKAAVVNLTQNVAREFAPRKVRVNALCPGFFPAEQNRKILTQQRVDQIMSQTPMARFGEAEELIGTVILLCSRTAGSFITGAAYYVDGGFTAMRF
jgi:NAD(P)-dependent dehydrogenase (short-subunit alcohol dehydrogenase family)